MIAASTFMLRLAVALMACSVAAPAFGQAVEKQLVATITAPQLDGGILSELAWDGPALHMQGVIANPDGSLSGRYLVMPSPGTTIVPLKAQTDGAAAYWDRKANRVSPTGLGRITTASDAKMPMYGIANLEQRIGDAVDMGGIQTKLLIRLGTLTLNERTNGREPYDGEIWSWSPADLNRIAYIDGKGDLWVAAADGRGPRRLLKGQFTLPAWSDDGRMIAVAERKSDRRWDVSVILVPADLRTVR